MNRITAAFRGEGLAARVLRSASWLMIGYGGSQALRLASNLVLTRILYPEAFGIMALVNVVVVGLAMFSDIGLRAAITQNPRGDDPDFLDTAWTIAIGRGLLLFLATLALAYPVARFYGEPDLALYLPVAGFSSVIAGFTPTKVETANRHLQVGRLTLLDLAAHLFGMACVVGLALATRSVVALALGASFYSAAHLVLTARFLPGRANRLRWERRAARELLHFGKWIFFSPAFWFITSQSDRAILGKFLSIETLGFYNIGYFLASFPYMLALSVNHKLMMPVYRDKPAAESAHNFRRQRQLRSAMTAGFLAALALMALLGPWLVDLLYDDRYGAAGAILVLVACALMPAVIVMTYDAAALTAGDSRSFAIYSATRATAQVALMLAGVRLFGLGGAIAAMGLAQILAYPVLVWLARRHRVWDRIHDLVFALTAALLAAAALRLHWERIADTLAALS